MSTKSLYEYCVSNVSKIDLIPNELSLHLLPTNILFDVLYQMCINENYHNLDKYFSDLEVVYRFLVQIKDRRNSLHFVFQSLMDFDSTVAQKMVNKYSNLCQTNHNFLNFYQNNNYFNKSVNKLTKLKFGLYFGSFLKESGWYALGRDVFISAIDLYDKNEIKCDRNVLRLVFECHWKLLSVLNSFCSFEEAMNQMKTIEELIDMYEMTNHSIEFNLAQVFAEFAQLFFFQSYYNDSYEWAIRSIEHLTPLTPNLTAIDVYRQAAKTSVVKREFKRAETLINQAMIICKEMFGVREEQNTYSIGVIHLKLADVFLDYGFYLLNVDLISHSVKLYEMALEIREHIFGLNSNNVTNLLIAMTHEELGYASYVHEYSSGHFLNASTHSNKAMRIVSQLLPENHLLLASAKRVKALILEEIAIDHHDKDEEERILSHSQDLHLSALSMARKAFGEINVQTAKHYGNLGRLYQSMKRYTEAEAMHLKAIAIKEELLGPNDYEVALSLGHLASLYNYDMQCYKKAEKLYLRSIDIGVKLFGVGYSGLEYDYQGLCRIYSQTKDERNLTIYMNKLQNWKHLRDSITQKVRDSPPIKGLQTMQKLSPKEIITLIEGQSN